MAAGYSVEVCRALTRQFHTLGLYRPMYVLRYDNGEVLTYDLESVGGTNRAKAKLVIEKFVGGGYAGQVYKVKILEIDSQSGQIGGLEVDGIYAMKILTPPSVFARLFRNFLYRIGFQGAFQLQLNPAAAKSGAIWQKFIRRATAIRFGDERAVADIHAVFIDKSLGSCGELIEWIEGRTWRLEVDDHLDVLKFWRKGKKVNPDLLGSAEYRAKLNFMAEFVNLLHDMGAHEFARQYEWSTCKSQPNCLKRKDTEKKPEKGLVAVDFRAGLTLLPFLPMSPGDFKLIFQGLKRGSLVQFDRGDLKKLEDFIYANNEHFSDMYPLLDELKAVEQIYRNSVPDITHNHIRLLTSGKLWSGIMKSTVTGWKTRNLINAESEQKLLKSKLSILIFFIIGLIPVLGNVIRKSWGQPDWRRHYRRLFTSWDYLVNSIQAKIIEKCILWHRSGRISEENALNLPQQPAKFFGHTFFAILPAGLHRFLTDAYFAKQKLAYIFVRPVKLYFNAEFREQWLREMVSEGKKKHMLSNEDADIILSQVKEPFIQKYLKSLAVHVCTLPVTQIVSVSIAIIYCSMHPDMSKTNRAIAVAAILGAFQIIPISPGSLTRGLYVLYLVIKERNFRDYNIAVFLGFFKYVGYLAFPIQMTYRYPALARFMAGHWATEAVHIVPVFGERGALFEHWVFCLFYNRPLTIRRKILSRGQIRSKLKPRYWHIIFCAVAGAVILGFCDAIYINKFNRIPTLSNLWWLIILLPIVCGAIVTLFAGGAKLWKRFVSAVLCGIIVVLLYAVFTIVSSHSSYITANEFTIKIVWQIFIFTILTAIGAIGTELNLSDPQLKYSQ